MAEMTAKSLSVRISQWRLKTTCRLLACRMVRLETPGPLVSFTFDDFPSSACTNGVPILEAYGIKATFYTAGGLAGKIGPVGKYFSFDQVVDLFQRGHEIGCHTFDHCHASHTRTPEYAASLERNQECMSRLLPQCQLMTHSYPIGYPTPGNKRAVSNRFAVARGFADRVAYGKIDSTFLPALFIEKHLGDLSHVYRLINIARQHRAWLVLATHDVVSQHSKYGCSPATLDSIARYTITSGFKPMTISEAFRFSAKGQNDTVP